MLEVLHSTLVVFSFFTRIERAQIPDLIVVGSHGYSGIKRWLLGSVAQSVVSHAPCSVEVVRHKLSDAA